MPGIFDRIRYATNAVTSSKPWAFYRRYLRVPLMAFTSYADIALSDNKPAAITANIGALGAAFFTRKMTGLPSYFIPTLVYGAMRLGGELAFGARGKEQSITGALKATAERQIPLRSPKKNKPVNPIKGHDAGRWGREQTFASGDFEPGSSVKDLTWAKRVYKASRIQKRALLELLEAQGIRGAQVSVEPVIKFSGVQGLGIEARTAAGEEILTARNIFEQTANTIDLTILDVAEQFRGKGIGRAFWKSQLSVFRSAGFAPGTKLTTPVVSPKTANYFATMVKDVAIHAESHPALIAKQSEVLQKVINKSYTLENFPAMMLEGALPEVPKWRPFRKLTEANKAVDPIKGHDAGHCGRDLVSIGRDFKPGKSKVDMAWKAIVGKIAEPLVAGAKKAIGTGTVEALEAFTKSHGIEAATTATAAFPASKFRLGAGRTVIKSGTREFGTISAKDLGALQTEQSLLRSGETQAVPTVPSIKALREREQIGDLLTESISKRWLATAGHEYFEANLLTRLKLTQANVSYLKRAHHISSLVPQAQGYLQARMGTTLEEIFEYTRPQDLNKALEGFKYGEEINKARALAEAAKVVRKVPAISGRTLASSSAKNTIDIIAANGRRLRYKFYRSDELVKLCNPLAMQKKTRFSHGMNG